MAKERRISNRKSTREVADLYHDGEFVQSCIISCVSPHGVFVDGGLPQAIRRGARVELYCTIDPISMPDEKLLCLRGIVMRQDTSGYGIRIYSKQLPIVPPAPDPSGRDTQITLA